MGNTRTVYFPLEGGEDLISPAMTVSPGLLRYSQNYELDDYGRPRRIDGFERFDGHEKPSDASYWIVDFRRGRTELSVGDIVTGLDSGATFEVYLPTNILDGSYDNGNAFGEILATSLSGTFISGEELQVDGSTVCFLIARPKIDGAQTDDEDDEYKQAAIEYARARISAVPGSGKILGVWVYSGTAYAFRNNAEETEAVMYKSSSDGWEECDLGATISFTAGGVTEILEGDTVTGASSGATATVKRVILDSGAWADGDAAGVFVLYDQDGEFESEELNTDAATISSDSTPTTLLPSGRFEFINYNFYGSSESIRMYGADGVNTAFEWDGSVFVPILTGMEEDSPKYISAYKKHLFLSFDGGSLQHSAVGDPYLWTAILGASEIGIGDEITGLGVMPGDVLAVMSRNSTYLLYGSSTLDWSLSEFSGESGAIGRTVQRMRDMVYVDDRGITSLGAVQEYGNFNSNDLSRLIKPVIDRKRTSILSSMRVKEKEQYRLFFDDGSGVYLKMSAGKVIGLTRVSFGLPVECCCSSEDSSGDEVLLFGSDNGFVYEIDSGTSFDGEDVEAYIITHYNHMGTPRLKKRFRKMVVELDAPSKADISFSSSYSYGSAASEISETGEVANVLTGGGQYDIAEWNDFVWDAPDVGSIEGYIVGSGLNVGFWFRSISTYETPHTFQGIVVHFDQRGLQR